MQPTLCGLFYANSFNFVETIADQYAQKNQYIASPLLLNSDSNDKKLRLY